MARKGGARPGAGRKPGNTIANLAKRPVTKAESEDIAKMAQAYAGEALETLASIMRMPLAPQASRVAASSALLDRGYGKAPQAITANVNATMTVQFATLYEPKPS